MVAGPVEVHWRIGESVPVANRMSGRGPGSGTLGESYPQPDGQQESDLAFHGASRWYLTWRSNLSELYRAARRHNYVTTLATELSVLTVSLLTLKLAAQLLDPLAFGEYAVGKRALSILTFTLACGLGIGVPRYLSLADHSATRPAPQGAYLLGAILVAGSVLSLFAMLCWSGLIPLEAVFFGSSFSSPFLVSALMISTLGLIMHSICYGYLRGRLWMIQANLLQTINSGAVPLLAVLLCHGRASRAIALMGGGWIVVSTLFGCWIGFTRPFAGVARHQLARATKDLLRYGIPRVPGEFALFGLTSIPAFVVAHRTGIQSAGQLSLAISVLQLIGALFTGIGVLLLPQVSRLAAQGNIPKARKLVKNVWAGALLITGVMVLVLSLSAHAVFLRFFGAGFRESADLTRWLLVGAFPYVTYLILRNPLDALSAWPYNSVNLWAGCSGLAALLWFGCPPAVSLTAALTLVGCLSGLSWMRCSKRLRA